MFRRPSSAALCGLFLSAVLSGCGSQETPAPPQDSQPVAVPDSTQTLRQRIAWLEMNRSFGGGELLAATKHADARVRLAAVVALGRIQDAAATGVLLERLEDEEPAVVQQTAWALRQLQGLDDDTRHQVQAAVIQQIDLVPLPDSWMFLDVLSRQGGLASTRVSGNYVASGIIASQGSQARPPRVEGMAALALAHVNDRVSKRTLGGLGDLNNRVGEATWRIAWAFSSAPDSSYYASALSLLRHPEPHARAAGARALEDIGIGEAREALHHALTDYDWEVRAAVLRALGVLGNDESIGFCISMLDDRHGLVREAACRALLKLGVGNHIAQLEEFTEDPVPAVRLLACQLLAKDGSQEQGLAAWHRARTDSVDFVRSDAWEFAVEALGISTGIDSLLQALNSTVVRERTQAATTLGGLDDLPDGSRQRIRQALEQHLDDGDPVVASVAAEALGELGFDRSLAALQQTWKTRPRSHADNDVLLAIATTAAKFAEDAAHRSNQTLADLLQQAAAHADPRIAHLGVSGLAQIAGEPIPDPPAPQARPMPDPSVPLPEIDLGQVRVRLTTNAGTAILELDGDRYPRTVGAFLKNIEEGLHDNGVFHRVVPAFVVQGGCPRGDGWGDAGYSIPCEYGDLRYDREGIVGMAHAGKDTGGTQFFIAHLPIPRLDGRYTAFGSVVEGMDVIDQIVRGDHFRLERIE